MADPQARFDHMIAQLREHGLRVTPQRMLVLKILAKSEDHPSVERIYEQVQAEFPSTSLATVYKTIATLKEMGEVLELSLKHDSRHYDGNKPYPHPHAICSRCHRIVDPEGLNLSGLADRIARTTGYRITSHQLNFFGLCPECLKE
jgi:Fur family peroxide stress response transcriptional regulator